MVDVVYKKLSRNLKQKKGTVEVQKYESRYERAKNRTLRDQPPAKISGYLRSTVFVIPREVGLNHTGVWCLWTLQSWRYLSEGI